MDRLGSVAVRYRIMNTLDKWTIIRSMAALIEIQKRGTDRPSCLYGCPAIRLQTRISWTG